MRMQIPTTHKAGLRRMSMNPPYNQQFLFIAVVEELLLVERLACIARAGLLGHD